MIAAIGAVGMDRGLAQASLFHKKQVPYPSRVLCERAGLLEAFP